MKWLPRTRRAFASRPELAGRFTGLMKPRSISGAPTLTGEEPSAERNSRVLNRNPRGTSRPSVAVPPPAVVVVTAEAGVVPPVSDAPEVVIVATFVPAYAPPKVTTYGVPGPGPPVTVTSAADRLGKASRADSTAAAVALYAIPA